MICINMKRIRDPIKKKEYQHRWYVKHKSIHRSNMKQQRIELINWFNELKSKLCCECGENHPSTLDFHHIDPLTKDNNVTEGVCRNRWSKERILREIKKCKVLCSNCHRKLHWNEKSCVGSYQSRAPGS